MVNKKVNVTFYNTIIIFFISYAYLKNNNNKRIIVSFYPNSHIFYRKIKT